MVRAAVRPNLVNHSLRPITRHLRLLHGRSRVRSNTTARDLIAVATEAATAIAVSTGAVDAIASAVVAVGSVERPR